MKEAWLKHFNISSDCTLQEALKTELISQSDYMKWASYYYGMPILKDQYFQEYPQLNEELWNKYPDVWNESLLPVLEWNDIVYVATLEPEKMPIDKKVVFLLTPAQCLENLWKQTSGDVSFKQEGMEETSYQKKSIPDEEIIIESSFLESLKILLIEKISFLLNFLLSPPPPKKSQKNDLPEIDMKPVAFQESKPLTLDRNLHEEPVQEEPVQEEPVQEEKVQEEKIEVIEMEEAPPITEEKVSQDQKSKESVEQKVQEEKIQEEKVQEEKVQEEQIIPLALEDQPKEEVKEDLKPAVDPVVDPEMDDVDESLDPVTKQLEATRKHIDSYILFSFKKDHFIPIKWSSDLQPKKKVKGTAKSPSIFRICYTSKQPYCGRMAPVISNNYFFNNWGFETLPPYVVMIPFVHEGKVLGGYLGISEKHVYSIDLLDVIDKIVKPLSQYYQDPKLLKKIC